MPTDLKPRVLRKLIDSAYIYSEVYSATGIQILSAATGGPGANEDIPHSNWEVFTNGYGIQFAVNRQYYDMQGYVGGDISFFPTTADIQDMSSWSTTPSPCTTFDTITVKPIDDAVLEKWFDATLVYQPPGSSWNNLDLQDIIYANWRVIDPSTDLNGASVITQSGSYGLNTPTARDRIYITRVVFIQQGDNQVIFVPPCAFVLAGVSGKEKDLVYLERLRRSYDVAQNV